MAGRVVEEPVGLELLRLRAHERAYLAGRPLKRHVSPRAGGVVAEVPPDLAPLAVGHIDPGRIPPAGRRAEHVNVRHQGPLRSEQSVLRRGDDNVRGRVLLRRKRFHLFQENLPYIFLILL